MDFRAAKEATIQMGIGAAVITVAGLIVWGIVSLVELMGPVITISVVVCGLIASAWYSLYSDKRDGY